MPAGNMISTAKDAVLIIGAVGGLMAGAYSQVAKPIQDEARVKMLETKMATIEPAVEQGKINVAVITSRLDKLDESQDKILNVVLDIKRKL